MCMDPTSLFIQPMACREGKSSDSSNWRPARFSFSKMVMRESLWFCAKEERGGSTQLEMELGLNWAADCWPCCSLDLQRSRWAWRRSSSQCGRSCCHCRPQSEGSLPSPGQTAGRKSWSARSPPSCEQKVELIKSESKEIWSKPTLLSLSGSKGKSLHLSYTIRSNIFQKLSGYVRATLDLQGADVLHPTLHDVLAAGGELHTSALEVLLIVHGDLWNAIEWHRRLDLHGQVSP